MFRLVGDVHEVKRKLEEWAGGKAEIEYGSFIPAQNFHTIPDFPSAPVAYTTDIPLLGRWGTPLLFGPGSIHVAHTPDEFIDVRRTPRRGGCVREDRAHAARDVNAPKRARSRWPCSAPPAPWGSRSCACSPTHPWFELVERRGVGAVLGKTLRRRGALAHGEMPANAAHLEVLACDPAAVKAPLVFSALDAVPSRATWSPRSRAPDAGAQQRAEFPHGSGCAAGHSGE